jgi:hypothetical protein
MIVFSLFMPFLINQYANAQIGVLPQPPTNLIAQAVLPQPPTNLIAQAVSSSQINLSWTAPSDLLISGYKIESSTDGGSTWSPPVNTGSTATTYSDSGLKPSTPYTYRVSTINPVGTSSPSTTASATTFSVVSSSPTPPTGLTATAVSSSQINLSWNAPTDNGGSPITGYMIERSTDGGSSWSPPVNTGSTATSYFDTGLSPSTAYTYRVSAINSAGTSQPSNTASATTTAQSAGITVYAHRIQASYWDPCFATECSAGTGPGATMYFELWDSSGNFVQSGYADENGYTFSGLNAGTRYNVYPADCGGCHGSNHDVVFQYWGDDHSTVRPRAAMVGASLDAWYSCTNGCGGGP